jgi:hypothetical protein
MAIIHSDWVTRINNLIYRNVGTLPDASEYRMGLCGSGLITKTMSKAAILSSELVQENGYSRKDNSFLANAIYYNSESRSRFDPITIEWTASGGPLQFSSLFLLADASPIANTPCTIAADKVIANNHGLIAGDEVCFTSISGQLPTNLQTQTLYKVLNPTTNDFQVATIADPATALSLGSPSGSYRLHYANGTIVEIHIEPDPRLLLDGQSYSVEIDRAMAAMNYGPGL